MPERDKRDSLAIRQAEEIAHNQWNPPVIREAMEIASRVWQPFSASSTPQTVLGFKLQEPSYLSQMPSPFAGVIPDSVAAKFWAGHMEPPQNEAQANQSDLISYWERLESETQVKNLNVLAEGVWQLIASFSREGQIADQTFLELRFDVRTGCKFGAELAICGSGVRKVLGADETAEICRIRFNSTLRSESTQENLKYLTIGWERGSKKYQDLLSDYPGDFEGVTFVLGGTSPDKYFTVFNVNSERSDKIQKPLTREDVVLVRKILRGLTQHLQQLKDEEGRQITGGI